MPQALASGSIQRHCTKTLSWKRLTFSRDGKISPSETSETFVGLAVRSVFCSQGKRNDFWKDLSECLLKWFFVVGF